MPTDAPVARLPFHEALVAVTSRRSATTWPTSRS